MSSFAPAQPAATPDHGSRNRRSSPRRRSRPCGALPRTRPRSRRQLLSQARVTTARRMRAPGRPSCLRGAFLPGGAPSPPISNRHPASRAGRSAGWRTPAARRLPPARRWPRPTPTIVCHTMRSTPRPSYGKSTHRQLDRVGARRTLYRSSECASTPSLVPAGVETAADLCPTHDHAIRGMRLHR